MKNKIFSLLASILVSTTLAFSSESRTSVDNTLEEAKEALISSHFEYAKASIERKCQKIKERIKDLEEQLDNLDQSSESDSDSDDMDFSDMDEMELKEFRIKKIMNKIKKYEKKLDVLRFLRLSIETFNAL